ncbi:aminotransferase class V-fold PLP-dependent enzyme [Paracoccus pantotrophus]|uniref:aminotransferase class V-fold PLP-dependent enzyme n=1 Tax=Paracoccus pantotrophus TaxID=82367 RepID=UPI000E09D146|nr:aminotransferase class V-fold PLP-dependent enzyme [Paracoccus pantotrophus]RDD95292.1 aminotransferase class V-fold PLP-dependent enzyme [Paracoccus pantotrophus]WGR64183.1 aminotransferase class V-fold PLP-dependent enzyme [Paracoccus pantotrophus]
MTLFTNPALPCQRDMFALPDGVAYLDAAYLSPIPIVAAEAGMAAAWVKARPWEMTIGAFYDEVEEARRLAAAMIGADADDIALTAATSYGMSIAAANVPVPAGSAIIMMENEHTSHRYVWYELAEKNGAHVVVAPKPEDNDWTAALIHAIKTSPHPVAVVAGSLVHWFEGVLLDLEAIADASREAGACLVVDGTQWVGALPFDVRRVRPDFLAFATYKFLLGPYRQAFLYADRRWHDAGVTLEHHSWNRIGGEKPDFYLVNKPGFMAGARRFDMGQRSDFATLPATIASLKLLQGWGLSAVAERLAWLNGLIWDMAETRGLIVARPKQPIPHIAILEMGESLGSDAGNRLKAAGVHVTLRGTKMRVSPHVYNDEADIRQLFDNLELRA